MPSTYLSLHYHLVFSTKHREPNIDLEWRPRLHEYLGGTISGLGGFPQGIRGVADHVHLLVGLKATQCLADAMRELKKASSVWIRDEIGLASFAWQEGYAAFTVSASARDPAKSYIAHQEQHHSTKSYREELVEMLAFAGVEYDPAYLDLFVLIATNPPGSRICGGIRVQGCRFAQPLASSYETSGFKPEGANL